MKVKNLVVAVFVLVASALAALAQGTAFTYQGLLSSSGGAANGSFDLRFGLYTNVSIGSQIGSLETNAAVGVTNGLFTTALNFSNAFNGSNYWVEIGVRTNGSTGTFTTLSPRQPITPTPYAITASNLTGTLPATQLTGTLPAAVVSGTFSNSVNFTNTTNIFVGNGAGLVNVHGVTSTQSSLRECRTQRPNTSLRPALSRISRLTRPASTAGLSRCPGNLWPSSPGCIWSNTRRISRMAAGPPWLPQ